MSASDRVAAPTRESDPFANDVLERLIRSNQDYQREHGHYIVPLAERLLEARVEIERLRERLHEARETCRRWHD